MSMNIVGIFYIFTILSTLTGLWITIRIFFEKRKGHKMVCPMGADCDTVIKSEFSTFFGIGLELYGIAYYSLIAVAYIAVLLFLPHGVPHLLSFILTGLSFGAFMFSVYLTFVQAFYIKSWCTWCLFSAGISTLIFILTTLSLVFSDFSLIPILVLLKHPIVLLHIIGFVLGVGGATISDVLFAKFLHNFKISGKESRVLQTMSQVVWVGLFIIVISGIGIYLPQMAILNESAKFITKMIIVSIIIINGAILNLVISPNLIKISCSHCINVRHSHFLRRLSFALGAISFVSWYSALILGSIKNIPLTLHELLTIYVLLVLFAVLFSQFLESVFTNKLTNSLKFKK